MLLYLEHGLMISPVLSVPSARQCAECSPWSTKGSASHLPQCFTWQLGDLSVERGAGGAAVPALAKGA